MSQGQPPVDLADPLAILRYGEDALDAALQVRVQDALGSTAVAALIKCLDELQQALQADDVRGAARKVGLLGRLFGQDLELQAQALALRDRLGVVLDNADVAAAALRAHVAVLPSLHRALGRATTNIADRIAIADAWLQANPETGQAARAHEPVPARQQLLRRLQQLRTVQASWELGAQQLQLVEMQQLELLARWQRIRDVLVPAWRRQAEVASASAAADQLQAANGTLAAITAEVNAITGKLAASRRPS